MANRYVLGNTVIETMVFEKVTAPFEVPPTTVLYDPALPTLIVLAPDASTTTYTYPANTNIQKVATGEYYATLLPNQTGTYICQWKDPDGTMPGLVEDTFAVIARRIT